MTHKNWLHGKTGKKRSDTLRMLWLDMEMVRRDATNERLAEVAGVSERLISKARNGGYIMPFFADCISKAIHSRPKFERHNNGGRKSV